MSKLVGALYSCGSCKIYLPLKFLFVKFILFLFRFYDSTALSAMIRSNRTALKNNWILIVAFVLFSAMKTKKQISFALAIVFLIQFCSSSQNVINESDIIKEHSAEIKDILNKFDMIIAQMSPVIPSSASASAFPFLPPVICYISEDELNELWKEIEREESDNAGYPVNFNYSNNCTALDSIKTAVFKLKHDFNEILKQQISSAKYEELKAAYEEQIKILTKRFDDEKANSDEEQKKIISELQDQLQQQRHETNKLLKQLEEEQNATNKANVDLCVHFIRSYNYDTAIKIFNKANNYQVLSGIMLSANSDIDNYDDYVYFVSQLSDTKVVAFGYESFYRELKLQNQLNDKRILMIAGAIYKNTLTGSSYVDTDSTLKTEVMNIIDKMAYEYEPFINYMNTRNRSKDKVNNICDRIVIMICEIIVNAPSEDFWTSFVRMSIDDQVMMYKIMFELAKDESEASKMSMINKAIGISATKEVNAMYVKNKMVNDQVTI